MVDPSQTPFLSAKKVMMELAAPFDQVEMFSLYSASNGLMFESGMKGGYFGSTIIDEEVAD